jgi:tripartite-type tricarboxylate transporter receptor subunit TctC
MISCGVFGRYLRAAGAAGLMLLASSAAFAQGYPAKHITIKIAYPAGGPADVSIRAANIELQRNLGQPMISENVPGAAGSVGATAALSAKADGYTLLGTTGADLIIAPFMVSSAKYQPGSFTLLGIVGLSDFVLVSSPAHSFKSIDELIDHVKKPGSKELSLAHWGVGSTPHIVGADLQARTGTTFLEVPYKGVAPVMTDLSGQHVDLSFAPLGGPVLELIQSGKVKAIAIAGDKRNPALPDVPTINESAKVKNFEYGAWSALFAPPDTPEPIVARLTDAMNAWLTSPENLERISKNGSRKLEPMTVAQAAAFFKSEREKVGAIVRALKLEPQ